MTSPAQPGIGDAYKLHHVMGHDPIGFKLGHEGSNTDSTGCLTRLASFCREIHFAL